MNSTERYEKAACTIDELYGVSAQDIISTLHSFSPDFGDWFVSFVFGKVSSRPHLSLQQRQLVMIASLTTQGDAEIQLSMQIRNALNVGLSPEQIVETIMYCIAVIGLPKAVNALRVAKVIFAEQGVHSNPK